MEQIREYLVEAYFPIVEKITNFQELDQHYQKPDSENFFILGDWPFYDQLLVAHLAGGKNIDVIADHYRRDYAANKPAAIPELEKFISLIKTEQSKA